MGRRYEKHDDDPAAFCLYKWKGSDSAGWSYLNADGYAATGWFEIGDQWYFSYENGSLLTNTVAPDGYRVDGSGAWVHEQKYKRRNEL